MDWYSDFVKSSPILSAVIQFALLGTFGEIVSQWMIKGKFHFPFPPKLTLWKMAVWSILAVCIKYAFVGFNGFVDALAEHGFLPPMNYYTHAFAVSAAMNIQFGLLLVLLHRMLDNLYPRRSNWVNINKSMLSLLWFWVPVHTITFMLPRDYQIGLAALWSVALGMILGYFNPARTSKPVEVEAVQNVQ